MSYFSGHLITTCPIINRKWVILLCFSKRLPHDIPSYNLQYVSEIEKVPKRQSHHILSMTNSKWVSLHIFLNGSLITTYACCDQQQVSNIGFSLKGILIITYLMTCRKWVILVIYARQSHTMATLCFDQQFVSNVVHLSDGIASPPVMNSWWVSLHTFLKDCLNCILFREWVVLHIFQKGSVIIWSTGSMWTFVDGTIFVTYFLETYRKWVTWHISLHGCLIMSCPIINSKWVMLHILLQGSLITLVQWLIDSKQDCMIFWQSHHILLYNQQEVSAHYMFHNAVSSHLVL